MTERKDGGPAFPAYETNDVGELEREFKGMTLRDWFAGQALAGMNANQSWDENGWKDRALQAYAAADAMLAERDK